MKFSLLAVVCSASRPGPGIPQIPGQDMVEIDFEPLVDGGPLDPLMLGASGPASGPPKKGKSPGGLSEKELDDVLADMIGPQNVPQKSGPKDLPQGGPRNLPNDLSSVPDGAEVVVGDGQNGLPDGAVVEIDGPPPRSEKEMDEFLAAMTGRPEPRPAGRQGKDGPGPQDEIIMGNGRNGLPEGVEVEVVSDDEPPPEMMMMGDGPKESMDDDMRMQQAMMKQLFPPGQMIIEEDDGPGPPRKSPSGQDAIIQDLMREMDQAMVQQVMPMAERSAEENLPSSCSKEIKANCRDAKSQLHCLGKHNADISDQCRADVGKAVPFLCSDAIDQYCDVLTGGILSCLGNQLSNLQGPCKDAVVATKKIIQKVNAQKPAQAAPKAKASMSAREAHLDAKLIGLSSSSTKAKPPPVHPELHEKLLDHDMRPTQQSESQASPPFFAWFVPLCIISAGAFAVHSSYSSYSSTPVIARSGEKETLCQRPMRTTSGMELLNPANPGMGRYDLEI